MRARNVLLVVLFVAAGAYLWLSGGSSSHRAPLPEQENVAPAPPTDLPPPRVEPTTGTLVVRVRMSDGAAVPEEARAGYLRFGSARLRRAAPDGTFPFSDAPVGAIEATAQAPGYVAESVPTRVVPGVPAEAIVTLTPSK